MGFVFVLVGWLFDYFLTELFCTNLGLSGWASSCVESLALFIWSSESGNVSGWTFLGCLHENNCHFKDIWTYVSMSSSS